MVRQAFEKFVRFTGGLRFKLSFYTGLVAFLSIVVFAYHSITVQEANLVEGRTQGALKDSEVIAAALWHGMMIKDREVIREIVSTIGKQEGFQEINIYDRNGVLHYTSDPELSSHVGRRYEKSELHPLLANLDTDESKRYEFIKGTNVVTVVNPLLNTQSCSTAECHAHPESHAVLGALEVKLQLKGLRTAIRENARGIIIFAVFLFLLISSIIGLAVIFLVTRPLDRLRSKAQRIAGGDYSNGIPAVGSDSIAVLSRALDEMSHQIRDREHEIDHRRRMYKELFEKAPCYLVVVDLDYRIVRANQTFVEAFGDPAEKQCFSAFKNCESKCPNCQVEKTFADGQSHRGTEIWHFKNSDEETHVIINTTPIPNEDGEITQVLEMAVDVTRLVHLQEELRKKEEQFKSLFENIPCYLTVIDRSFRIGFFNKMFLNDFGHRWGEACYRAYKGRTEKCPNCPVEKTFLDGQSHYSEEIWNLHGQEQHIVVRTSPLRDDTGTIVAVMEMCTNVTELKVLENRLAILGETIAATSHAIKNILAGLEGGVYVVDSGLRSGKAERIRSGWDIVKKNVGLVSVLVKEILNASKDRAPELQNVDPGQVLNEVADLFGDKAQAEGVRLVKAFDDKMGEGMLDPVGVHNVVSNLISNAISACTQNIRGGSHQIILAARIEDGHLMIEVTDTGAGMSDDVKLNLFKKFYSTKGAKGTGLGLLVSRKIVEENGGTIGCESELGRGTRFIVRLPFKRNGDMEAQEAL